MTEHTKAEIVTTMQSHANLIKAAFKGNDYLLKVMRNIFFGFEVSKEDKALVKTTFASPLLYEVVRRKMCPIFSDTVDVELGGVADYWMDMEKEILGAFPDAINQRVFSKQQVLEMLEQALKLLKNPEEKSVDLSYNPKLSTNDPLQINLLARSLYIRTVTQGLSLLKLIANIEDKTAEQKLEQNNQNSSK